MKPKYYSLKNILSENAEYNFIISERSKGKTYAYSKYALEDCYNNSNECIKAEPKPNIFNRSLKNETKVLFT